MEPAYTEFNTVFADLSKYFDYKDIYDFNTIYMPLCEHTPKLRADNI